MKRTLASGPKREKRVCSISFNTVSGYSSPSQRVKFTSEDGLLSAAIQGKTEVLSIHACHLEPQLTFKTLLINFSAILFDSPTVCFSASLIVFITSAEEDASKLPVSFKITLLAYSE